MRVRTTLLLLLTVCILGVGLWVMQHTADSTARRLAASAKVLGLDLTHVDALVVRSGGVEMEIEQRGSEWWIVRPIEARADEAMVGRLLSTSEALANVETITREQREHRALSLGDYGLDVPHTSVTYRTSLGERCLLIGHDARLGNRTYVRIDGESDVMLAEGGLRQVLPESLEAMRDRVVLPGQPARVVRIEIERPGGGFVQLLRSRQGWTIQQPLRDPADAIVVSALLDALFAARVERFIWDPPVGSVATSVDAAPVVDSPAPPVESYGLAADMAPARLRVWLAGDDVGRELTLGKAVEGEDGTVYAMFADNGSVFTVAASLLQKCQVEVDDLRSRALIRLDPARIRYLAVQQGDRKLTLGNEERNGWSILEPIQWAADRETVVGVLQRLAGARIQSFVDAPATNLVALGREAVVLHITLDTVYPPAASDGEANGGGEELATRRTFDDRIELAAVDNGSDDQMLVQMTGRTGRFNVRRDALVFLPEAARLPLTFFDRTVLAVSPDRVQRVTMKRGDLEQVLERDEEGKWMVREADGRVVDAMVLSDILFRVSNLRAARVADQHPKDLSVYGLDATDMMLTIGLTGSDAIQKTILVGAEAGAQGGRYAIIQGQDVVFVLTQEMVDGLLQSLVTTAEVSEVQ